LSPEGSSSAQSYGELLKNKGIEWYLGSTHQRMGAHPENSANSFGDTVSPLFLG
jgi:hypothetical protein